MQDSIRLGKISGIPIGLHWSIALIAGLFTLTLAGTILPAAAPGAAVVAYWVVALATTAVLLGSIVAHELGHSIVAQNNGVGVSGITLFALGGVAKLESEPEEAGVAGRIALAGPAVSVVIGAGALGLAAVSGALGLPALLTAGITWLGIINLVMAVFNMIPALPLDGGRALQAFLWHRSGERHPATIRAAQLGRYIGWALIGLGLWQFSAGTGGLWTAFIGWFIVSSARAEGLRARMQLESERGGRFTWPSNLGQAPAGGPAFDHRAFNARFGPPSTDGRPMNSPFGPPPTSPPSGSSPEVIDVEGSRVG